MSALQAIRYDAERKQLEVLDQTLLPHCTRLVPIQSVEQGWDCIHSMQVRGAPAIAIVACLALACDGWHHVQSAPVGLSLQGFRDRLLHQMDYLRSSRPTAVNLFQATDELRCLIMTEWSMPACSGDASVVAGANQLAMRVLEFAEHLFARDVEHNRAIGRQGADWLLSVAGTGSPMRVLTHCNTGSLATAGYGTALGIIRCLNEHGWLQQVFCTETRPYNQGSRLTAYECVVDRLPKATLICDSMAAALMRHCQQSGTPLTAVIVGADRVAANGDTANKIGTYALALAAKHHGVRFVVAAPSTSIDLTLPSGDHIPIEERPGHEVTTNRGVDWGKSPDGSEVTMRVVQVGALDIAVWNPAFDVTPAELIDAIVTERGVCLRPAGQSAFPLRSFLHPSSR